MYTKRGAVQLVRQLPLKNTVPEPQVEQLFTYPRQVAQTGLHKSQVLLIVLAIVKLKGQVETQFEIYQKAPLAHVIH